MSTLTLPEVPPVDTDDDGPAHIVCCDPLRGLCGTALAGIECDEDDPCPDCVVCEELWDNDVPCGALFCRLRQWMRGDR